MKNIVDRFPDKNFTQHPSDMQLTRFQEHTLNAQEERELESHLAECKRCRTILIEANRSHKEMELKPVNNRNYFKALSPLIAGVAGLIIFVSVPMIDSTSSDIHYKGIEIEKGVFESSMEYWEELFEKYFGK